jgi:hypothetical protein
MLRTRALRASRCLLPALLVFAGLAHATNPAGLAWKKTTNVSLYGKPTGMLIAGRCNMNDPAFQAARAKGAEVLVYLAPTERPDHFVCTQDTKFYMNDIGRVPLWPYPSYGQQVNWPNTHTTDMRPGSAWIRWVVQYVEGLMREGKVDGVFLDVVGARVWSSYSGWSNWPQTTKNIWTDGNVDLVRRLDARRRAVDPDFIVINNNVWDRGDTRGLPGEQYVDGIAIEHPRPLSPWHVKYIAKPFGNLGHRRTLVIANTTTDARAWAAVKGVTHVTDQKTSEYGYPKPPSVPFQALTDR